MSEFRAVPKPPGREFEALERAAQPERDAHQARVRLAAEAKAGRKARGTAIPDRPNLIERILRIGRGGTDPG